MYVFTAACDVHSLSPILPPSSSHIPNALPYIGAYLEQIYSLEMNSKTYNDDGLVNFAKMTKVSYHFFLPIFSSLAMFGNRL